MFSILTTNALEVIGQHVTEYELCNRILNGLGLEYDSVHTSIVKRETPISFEEVFGQLLTFELRSELHAFSSSILTPVSALYTNNSGRRSGPCGQGQGCGRDRNYNLGVVPPPKPLLIRTRSMRL